MWPWLFFFFALVGVLLGCWQWVAARRFFSRSETFDSSRPSSSELPPITILKPLSGVDEATESCLRSWLEQKYSGDVQWLLGVESESDPAWVLAEKLIRDFPLQKIQLVCCDQKRGENPKVSKLIQLSGRAEHEFLIVSDADVRIAPGFLSQFAQELNDSANGIVCCLYRLLSPESLPMKLERLHNNVDFWSQVLMSVSMKPLDFALGAVMGSRKETLEKCGGFTAVADVLADDFQLGQLAAKAGHQVRLSKLVVDCNMGRQSIRRVWNHQIRWSRTIRVCRPVSYAFSLVANVTLWSVFAMLASSQTWMILVGAAFIAFRVLIARSLLKMFSPKDWDWKCWFLVPLKDLLHVGILIAGYTGNRIEWRGRSYILTRGAGLVEIHRSEWRMSRMFR